MKWCAAVTEACGGPVPAGKDYCDEHDPETGWGIRQTPDVVRRAQLRAERSEAPLTDASVRTNAQGQLVSSPTPSAPDVYMSPNAAFGFTREDVRALEEAWAELILHWDFEQRERLRSLASRINALIQRGDGE